MQGGTVIATKQYLPLGEGQKKCSESVQSLRNNAAVLELPIFQKSAKQKWSFPKLSALLALVAF